MYAKISLGNYYGIDTLIDFLILLVALLISYESHRIYKLLNEKNYKFFSWAFLAISISFFFKIITNFTLAYKVIIQKANFVTVIIYELESSQLIHFLSYIIFKALLVAGFLILFLITTKTDKKEDIVLFLYLSFIAVLFSIYFDSIFHITIAILLFFLSLYFYKNYKRTASKHSFVTLVAFVVMLFSHLVGAFCDLYPGHYLLEEALIFIGFLTLLINHLKLKHGEKKNEARGYPRPFRNSKGKEAS